MTVRVGVLGCGGIARAAHLPSLAGIPGARVVAVADPDAAHLAAARRFAPSAQAVGNFGAVLEMPDVDAVIIALPPALHTEAATSAIAHGKHVYLEKPSATSLADARRLLAAWEGSGLTAMIGFNYRRNPIVEQARRALGAGAVGMPIAARTVFATPARPTPSWKARRDGGGGVLLDLAVHHIDLIRFVLGAEVSAVSAELRSLESEDDTALVQLCLTNGCTVQSFFSLASVEEDRIDVFGTAGKLAIDRYGSLRPEVTATKAGGALGRSVRRLAAEWSALPYALRKRRAPMHDPSFPAAIEAFVGAVRDRRCVEPNPHDAVRALAVVEAAEASARSRRTVTLDAAPNSTLPFPPADVARG